MAPQPPCTTNGKGLEVTKSSYRLAMDTPAAHPTSQHPPARFSYFSRLQLASSLEKRAPSGVSPSPGGVPQMAVAGEAAASFAPITAGELYGSEVAFGCDDLGAAEAIAGQLAYQLGPSLDFGPSAPGGSPASSPSVSPHPATGPPPAGPQTRIPLSELTPDTIQGTLQGRNPPQSEGVGAIRNGTPLLLEPDTCHPKTATKVSPAVFPGSAGSNPLHLPRICVAVHLCCLSGLPCCYHESSPSLDYWMWLLCVRWF